MSIMNEIWSPFREEKDNVKVVFQHSGILPVVKYGGIERILFWHMKELAKRGHDVVFFGKEGSQVEKYGIEFHETPESIDEFEELIPKDADLLHLTYNYTPKKREIPTLNNIQGNGQIGEEFPLNTVFVSEKHAKNHGSDCFVYNAIDLEEYPFFEKEMQLERFLFLAKGSWSVKNLKQCVWAVKKAKKTLEIAGGRTFFPSRYINSHGMVGGAEKLSLLQKTDALLFPVRWHEPFGIAIIEAMAMGSPVFGSPYGSLPELITEECGLVLSDKEELRDVLMDKNAYQKFERRRIRNYIENNFSLSRLTDDYLELYERILAGEKLNQKRPSWCLEKPPLELLPF